MTQYFQLPHVTEIRPPRPNEPPPAGPAPRPSQRNLVAASLLLRPDAAGRPRP
jgi:hypothetical protein